jgi:hypothetical protein
MSLMMDRAGLRSIEVDECIAERLGETGFADLDVTKVIWVKQFTKLSLPISALFVHFHLTTYSIE